MDLIYREVLLEKLNKFEVDTHESAECYSSITEIIEVIEYIGVLIDDVPNIEAVPVVHGEWVAQDEGLTKFMCSVCKGKNHGGHEKFCPECGADMRTSAE